MKHNNMMTNEEKERKRDFRNAMMFLGILGAIVVAGGAIGAAVAIHKTGHNAGAGFLFGSVITGGVLYIGSSLTNDLF